MSQEVSKKEEKTITYVPYGAKDKIELSIGIVNQFIANPTKSGKLPEKKDIVNFMMMCQAKRLNPFEGDAFLIGYDGKNGPSFSLITAHQAFLKRAELHPEFDGMESGVSVRDKDGNFVERQGDFYFDDEELLGGWAKVHFKKRNIPIFKRVNLKTFRKPTQFWDNNPAGMIVKCAEADALRSSFPTMLGGLIIKEEMYDAESGTNVNLTGMADSTSQEIQRRIQQKKVQEKKEEPESIEEVEHEIVEDEKEEEKQEDMFNKAEQDEKEKLAKQIVQVLTKLSAEIGKDAVALAEEWTGSKGVAGMVRKNETHQLQDIYNGIMETYYS